MLIRKRDGRQVVFDSTKVVNAMCRAFISLYGKDKNRNDFIKFCSETASKIFTAIDKDSSSSYSVEDIQDMVEHHLLTSKYKDVAREYISYRTIRTMARENTIDKIVSDIVNSKSPYWESENSNKDSNLATTQRDYIAGAVSTDESRRFFLPAEIVKAHDEGIIHFHDMDYFVSKITNCCLVNLEDMLQNGTVISKVKIDKPHKFSTACNIATQIIAQVASSQYGGQSITLSHLSPFVEDTYNYYKNNFPNLDYATLSKLVEKDIEAGIQTLQYQIVTLMTTNGQAPFITIYMNLAEVPWGAERDNLAMVIEEVLKQRMEGVKNSSGVWITPAFPKLIYALDKCNISPDSEYYYLTVLAAQCSAKRMVPDYISNKIQRELKNGDTYPCMGCRSFLTVDRTDGNLSNSLNYDKYKYHKYYGRFNQGVVTLNLVDVALSSGGNEKLFYKILDERLDLCHKALQCRHKKLLGTPSDIAPILWQNGAFARLKPGETIDKLLYDGYSTISLGYAGLYECTKYMTGKSHTSQHGRKFALKVMKELNYACEIWKAEENIDYSVYGTPLESTTYKFAQCLKDRFGVIEGITDHDYITNSYHLNVREDIDAFTKLKAESEFQCLSPGGAISYVEVPDLMNNPEVVCDIIDFIYDNILYAEINCKSDYCQKCGYTGEIKIKGESGALYWECPNCGNTDKKTLNVARRTCGYIGTNFWNQGRTEEIKDRVMHLDTLEKL